MYTGGYITDVKCEDCDKSFPVFTFSADTDMATAGCIALTSIERRGLILTMQKPSESIEELNRRIGPGYKVVEVKYESVNQMVTGSFQEFRKTYQSPNAIYKCIFCDGKGFAIGRESKDQFLAHGAIEVRDAL